MVEIWRFIFIFWKFDRIWPFSPHKNPFPNGKILPHKKMLMWAG
jgi:hypothetical protein